MEETIHLSWFSHKDALANNLSALRLNNTYCDVTVCCNGVFFPAHRLILSTFSDYFKKILELVSCRHPFIITQDVLVEDFKDILDFMYIGEATLSNSRMRSFLKTAKNLMIKGLNYSNTDEHTSSFLADQNKIKNSEIVNGLPEIDCKTVEMKDDVQTFDEPLNHEESFTSSTEDLIILSESLSSKNKEDKHLEISSTTEIRAPTSRNTLLSKKFGIKNSIVLLERCSSAIELSHTLKDTNVKNLENTPTTNSAVSVPAAAAAAADDDFDVGNFEIETDDIMDHDSYSLEESYEDGNPLLLCSAELNLPFDCKPSTSKEGLQEENENAIFNYDMENMAVAPTDLLELGIVEQSDPIEISAADEMNLRKIQNEEKSNGGNVIRKKKKRKGFKNTQKKQRVRIPKLFFCHFCSYKASQPNYLKVHLRIHTGEKPFQCDLCPYKSTQKSALNTHMLTHEDTLLKCDVCSYETKRSSEMEEHKTSHYEGVTYSCDKCSSVFKRKQCLQDHSKIHVVQEIPEEVFEKKKIKKINKDNRTINIKTVNGKKLFQCKLCFFNSVQAMKVRFHVKENHIQKFCCPLCPYKISDRLHLERHLLSHNPLSPRPKFYCNLCPFIASQKSHLQYHLNVHKGEKPFKCGKCNHTTRSRSNLSLHMKLVHGLSLKRKMKVSHVKKINLNSSLNKDVELQSDDNLNSSVDMGVEYQSNDNSNGSVDKDVEHQSKYNLNGSVDKDVEHQSDDNLNSFVDMGVEQSDDSQSDNIVLKEGDQSKNYPLEVDLILSVENKIKTEDSTQNDKSEDVENKNSPEKRLKCFLCPFTCNNNILFQQHRERHCIKRYICTFCPYQINDRVNYLRHMRLHAKTNGFKYRCRHCPYGAKSEHLLRYHQNVHTGEKPFTCDICSDKFIAKNVLTKHIIKKHS